MSVGSQAAFLQATTAGAYKHVYSIDIYTTKNMSWSGSRTPQPQLKWGNNHISFFPFPPSVLPSPLFVPSPVTDYLPCFIPTYLSPPCYTATRSLRSLRASKCNCTRNIKNALIHHQNSTVARLYSTASLNMPF